MLRDKNPLSKTQNYKGRNSVMEFGAERHLTFSVLSHLIPSLGKPRLKEIK